jgi:hypothetical protein
MSQIISLAEVTNVVDGSRGGAFKATIDELDGQEVPIKYTSPYASNGEGAFIGIPQVGVRILVCKPSKSDAWYYLGATFDPPPREVLGNEFIEINPFPLETANKQLYKARGVPMQVQLTGAGGAGIVASEEYNPDYMNSRTEIKSNVNKVITLCDSPAIDAIIIDSGNGSTIKLGDNPQEGTLPAQSIEIESVGPQKYLNIGSQTDVVVETGGRELQLLNQANGVEWGDGAVCGNVNIQSKWKDVNVFTQAEAGRIFIECLNENGSNQVIQIETNGAEGAIIIKTKGDIRLDAGGNIDLNAGGQIRMKSGGPTNITCPSLEIAVAGNANIEANTIELANGANADPPSVEGTQSTYGNTGITTY